MSSYTSKSFLQSIVDSDYQQPEGIELYPFLSDLLANFSSTDPELRDSLTYAVFARFVNESEWTREELTRLLYQCLDEEHLFYRIGEKESDSVLMRSFSLLALAVIIGADRRLQILADEAIQRAHECVLNYVGEELDYRGYLGEKGWAHAVAHAADVLDELGLHPTLSEGNRTQLLAGISRLATVTTPLICDEDDRLAFAARTIINRCSMDAFMNWLEQFKLIGGRSEEEYIAIANSKNFLRSLYLQMKWQGKNEKAMKEIEKVLMRGKYS
ncbi:DUF2785 domain-containing protein [Mechercharimyces sp. CAU 1602]|uniref:DUF2785 domain-containing protein n=1 Tax=Mechercharimyces sp. CAU 1602 TaxID=2973933 RepID=UPI00216115FF|nr:DUF2785 domain-containing protein [Mechercharimyces sp. CAU 1602]MCS1351102.1 DUF2785 domain-containing protein [Mechercharimyces sp. CAU 1602]